MFTRRKSKNPEKPQTIELKVSEKQFFIILMSHIFSDVVTIFHMVIKCVYNAYTVKRNA